jgi:hypothetical protein
MDGGIIENARRILVIGSAGGGEFLRYIWNFARKESPEIMEEIARHEVGVPLLVLRKPGEVKALLAHPQAAV